MKCLQILRHAKSSWKDLSVSDHDRKLNKRGKRTAPLIGKRLAQKEIKPQQIISSTAKRALKTAKIIANEIAFPVNKIAINRSLFHASEDEILSVIAETENNINRLMIVGHNPGLTFLTNHLCESKHYFANIPTAGLVTLSLDILDWQQIKNTDISQYTNLLDYDYPKKT